MVMPEGAERQPEPKKKPNRTVIVALVAVLAVGGLLAFSALTQPEPEAVEDTSTTSTIQGEIERPIDLDNFDVGQIATGDQLDWSRTGTVGGNDYGLLLAHGSEVLLFTQEEFFTPFGHNAAETRIHRLGGAGWEELGTLPEGTDITTITSTEIGLMAVAAGEPGQPSTLLKSDDGTTWQGEPLPQVTESKFAVTNATALSANSAATVLALTARVDVRPAANDRLVEEFGSDLDLSRYPVGTVPIGGELMVRLFGPFNIPLWEFPAAEIGLEEADSILLNNPPPVQVTSRAFGEDWSSVEIDAFFMNSIVATDDGSILMFGWPRTGGDSYWLSYDGFAWENISSGGTTPMSAVSTPSGLVGLPQSSGQLVTSERGFEWTRVFDGEFPVRFGWWTRILVGGDSGAAAVFEGQENNSGPIGGPEPVTITEGDSTLTLDFSSGQAIVRSPTDELSFVLFSDQVGSFVEADLANGTVSFVQPDTEDVLMTIPIDKLQDAQETVRFRGGTSTDSFKALVYSTDNLSWAIVDIESVIGPGVAIDSIAITDSQIVLAARQPDHDQLDIWTAPLP